MLNGPRRRPAPQKAQTQILRISAELCAYAKHMAQFCPSRPFGNNRLTAESKNFQNLAGFKQVLATPVGGIFLNFNQPQYGRNPTVAKRHCHKQILG